MMRDDAVAAEVTRRAMDRYDAEIEALAERTVWAEDCHSWYKTESGRITNNWPDYTVRYRRRLRHPVPGDVRLTPRAALTTGRPAPVTR